jgi:hypothetical protein
LTKRGFGVKSWALVPRVKALGVCGNGKRRKDPVVLGFLRLLA